MIRDNPDYDPPHRSWFRAAKEGGVGVVAYNEVHQVCFVHITRFVPVFLFFRVWFSGLSLPLASPAVFFHPHGVKNPHPLLLMVS